MTLRTSTDKSPVIEQLSGYEVGQFISESKNRFLCTVRVNGTEEACYIASSCRLDNFIDLRGKDVLLQQNKGRNLATRYSVVAVKHKRSYLLLNTSWANRAVAADIRGRRFSFLGKRCVIKRETEINGYRADFYVPETKTILEIKGVISTSSEVQFPTVFSERTIHQLETIEHLLAEGYRASFVIVALNPYAKEIQLLKGTECSVHLSKCVDKGLVLKGFSCQISTEGEPCIKKEIPIIIKNERSK